MSRKIWLTSLLLLLTVFSYSQQPQNNFLNAGQGIGTNTRGKAKKDSLNHGHKEIPKGVRVWTIDRRFGDMTRQPLDTVTHMFQNSPYTAGMYGEYNFTGNLGSPRINRIFADRPTDDGEFLFTVPYSYFIEPVDKFLFTNTYSPYASLSYNTCGNRTNGEDHFGAKFAVNAGRKLGVGFKVDYLYGRGYYSSQSTSHFAFDLFGSYIGDQYQAHLLFNISKQKVTENGGITDDMYITHPESFGDSYATNEIPTMLSSNWNRNSHIHLFLTHRYNLGFHRKVPMTKEEIEAKKFAMQAKEDNKETPKKKKHKGRDDDEEDEDEEEEQPEQTFAGRPDDAKIAGDDTARNDTTLTAQNLTLTVAEADSLAAAASAHAPDTAWLKTEYVPVTSFIHTAQFDTHERIYQAYASPEKYYANMYLAEEAARGDSIHDITKTLRLRNTLAVSMLEGFNKWMVAGIKLFAASDLRRHTLPDTLYTLSTKTLHNLSVGAQISRRQGRILHYSATAEACVAGDELGALKVDASIDLNFPLWRDTMTFVARGFFHNEKPNYYMRHYHSKHYWWDDDLSKQQHTRIEAMLDYRKTRTSLRFVADMLTNHTYFAASYDTDPQLFYTNNTVAVRQAGSPISILTASIDQRFTLGPVNWETRLAWQKSTNQQVVPVPAINIYTNLYLKFRIAKVLHTQVGCDMRYFTSYEAPLYVPGIGQFAVQEQQQRVSIGNYPIVNLYANFNLKGTRFFVVYSHGNAALFSAKRSFLTPHYPLNNAVLRLGLCWNFYN